MNNIEIYPIYIIENNQILCEAILLYASKLPEYIQICFFESLHNQQLAVKMLVDKAIEIGKKHNCKKVVVGLNGHVNYGLGLLNSNYDIINSFSASANPKFYNNYFVALKFLPVKMNTYIINNVDDRLKKYSAILNKVNKSYQFKKFNKKEFNYYSKIYTDLNNKTFNKHRYYYSREYIEDQEMLKELFLFMKEDSLIFAFKDNKPIGFIMWYPDFNELCKKGEVFGVKHYLKNIFLNKKITTAKIMEYGILDEYRKIGLPLGLINQVFLSFKNYNINRVITSWILDENKDSNSVCEAICDGLYKRYVVYEKRIK